MNTFEHFDVSLGICSPSMGRRFWKLLFTFTVRRFAPLLVLLNYELAWTIEVCGFVGSDHFADPHSHAFEDEFYQLLLPPYLRSGSSNIRLRRNHGHSTLGIVLGRDAMAIVEAT